MSGLVVDRNDPAMDRFIRYFGGRPRGLTDLPMYAPDRDFAQLTLILNQMDLMLEPAALPITRRHLRFNPTINDDEFVAGMREGMNAIVDFFSDACGINLRTGEAVVSHSKDFVSVKQAMLNYEQACHQDYYADKVLQLLGMVAMDFMFFAGRQDRCLGAEGKYTFEHTVRVGVLYHQQLRSSGDADFILRHLQDAIQAAMTLGMTGQQISRIVDEVIVTTARPA